MKITVQFFSRLRDAAGVGQTERELVPGATVATLIEAIYRDFPALREWDDHLLIAAGDEYAQRDHVVNENEVISLMPPVQGG